MNCRWLLSRIFYKSLVSGVLGGLWFTISAVSATALTDSVENEVQIAQASLVKSNNLSTVKNQLGTNSPKLLESRLRKTDIEEIGRLIGEVSKLEEQDGFSSMIPFLEELSTVLERTYLNDTSIEMMINTFLSFSYHYAYSNTNQIPAYILEFDEEYSVPSLVEENENPRQSFARLIGVPEINSSAIYTANGRERKIFSSFLAVFFANNYRTHLRSQELAARRLSISLTKQKSICALALTSVLSKFFVKLLQRSIQAFERSITHRTATGTKPDLPVAAFSAFDGFGESSNLSFRMMPG